MCVVCQVIGVSEWSGTTAAQSRQQSEHCAAHLEFDVLCYALSFSHFSAGSFPSKEGKNKLWRTLNVDNI